MPEFVVRLHGASFDEATIHKRADTKHSIAEASALGVG